MNPNVIILATDSKRKTAIERKSNQYKPLANPPFGSNFPLVRAS